MSPLTEGRTRGGNGGLYSKTTTRACPTSPPPPAPKPKRVCSECGSALIKEKLKFYAYVGQFNYAYHCPKCDGE